MSADQHDDDQQTADSAARDWSTYSGPVWSASEAARRCNMSRTTLTRRLKAGDIPGAEQTADGWRIPAQGLAIAGLVARTAPDDQDTADSTDQAQDDQQDAADSTPARVAILQAELATERARREGAERLADERAARITDLQTALRAIAPPPPAEQDDSAAPTADQPDDQADSGDDGDRDTTPAPPGPQTASQPAPQPRPGLFARLRAAITGD